MRLAIDSSAPAALAVRRGSVAFVVLVIAIAAGLYFEWIGAQSVWQFNFAPEVAPDFAGFEKVSAATLYEAGRGYGWLDSTGELRKGTYQNKTPGWEVSNNLNLILRAGPDDLARSFASGSTTFALDLEAGSYDVWVLTGDWGSFEYFPHEPYTIDVEGVAIEIPGLSETEFYRRFETPGGDDLMRDDDVYARYVEPRFQWRKLTVSVSDGQLSIRVAGQRRDTALLSTTGYYPWTDIKYGPNPSYAGALNGLVVTRADADSASRIDEINERRRQQFRAAQPWVVLPADENDVSESDLRRGYNLFVPNDPQSILPETTHPHELEAITLRATPGEYVPFSIALQSHRALGMVRVQAEGLPFPIDTGVVRYELAPVERPELTVWERALRKLFGPRPKPLRWRTQQGPIIAGDSWEITAATTKQFWLTLPIPTDAEAGSYVGSIEIRPVSGEPSRIPIELEILPFSLRRPTHLAVGATYFVPVAYSYYGDYGQERFWARVRAEFEDMRRHGMTTVQLTGMGIENYEGLDRLFQVYRDAGFEQPIYLLEAYTAIEWVIDQYGHAKGSEAFYAKYVELFETLVAEAKRRNWPPLIFNFGDEFTNTATEEFGAELARRLKQIPDIVIAADANGYKEVMLMAPHVSIVAFNGGWDGPNGVNQGRHLLNAETVAEIRAAGATPWLVNVDKSRFSNGMYLWKMSRLGIGGKIEWMYSDYAADPHNPFDGRGPRMPPMVYPGPSSSLPTIPYELIRQGLDDLAYLHTLGTLAEQAPDGPQRKVALELLEHIDVMIDDDYFTYRDLDAVHWPAQRYNELRDDVIERILALQAPN